MCAEQQTNTAAERVMSLHQNSGLDTERSRLHDKMDATQALSDAENSLRDFIGLILGKKGGDWIEHCGVTEGRITIWKERKATAESRKTTEVADQRLIYYADFYDLRPILKKHWPQDFCRSLENGRRLRCI